MVWVLHVVNKPCMHELHACIHGPTTTIIVFLKREQKICPNLLIKKKRIAQLINGKPGENRYSNTSNDYPQSMQPLQPQTLDTLINTPQMKTNRKRLPNTSIREMRTIHQATDFFLVASLFLLLILR
jgi:hypothetical protein